MKKSIFILLCLYVFISFLFSSIIYSQDFELLLDAVNKVENNLKEIVDNEATMRSEEINLLKAEIKKLKKVKSGSFDASLLVELKNELEKLHKQVENLSKPVEAVHLSNDDLETLLNDIEFLKAENLYLRSLFERNKKQLASTDEESITEVYNQFQNSTVALQSGASEDFQVGSSELDISGFFDVVGTHQTSTDDETEFGLGQAEIDLESELSDIAAISVAVAYNNETGNFEVGAAELNLNLSSDENRFVTSADVVAGQFDVPFGIDYQVYASIDRKLITEPWFADIHGGWRGWNDFGIQFQAGFQYGNFVGFWVNGFEESAEVTQRIINLTTGLLEDTIININTTPADAFGSRIGIIPVANLEIGGSFAVGFNQSGKDEMTLMGADLQITLDNLFIKGEYLHHSVNRSIAKEGHQGFYIHPIYSFNRVYVTGRYSSFKPNGLEWIDQVSLGIGYSILENVELRFETIINENKDANQNILQLVTGF